MSLGYWNKSDAHFYISDKHGSDTNDGSINAPFKSLDEAVTQLVDNNLTNRGVVIKEGFYQPSGFNFGSNTCYLYGDGNVLLTGQGTEQIFSRDTNAVTAYYDLIVENFNYIQSIEAMRSRFRNINSGWLSGARYSDFVNSNLTLYFSVAPKIGRQFFNSNFINCGLSTNARPLEFTNCYLDSGTSISTQNNSVQPVDISFTNCVFQNKSTTEQFSVYGHTTEDLLNAQANPGSLPGITVTNCKSVADPLFNYHDPNGDVMYYDFSLQWLPSRSPLYLGRGMFAGSHKFAVPMIYQAGGPFATSAGATHTNISIGADGAITLSDPTLPGVLISSETNPLSFGEARQVNSPFRFVGGFYFPGLSLGTGNSERATYRIKIKDSDTGQWETEWYTMAVNAPWQVSPGTPEIGNGDPAFTPTDFRYLTCQEFQVEITIAPTA